MRLEDLWALISEEELSVVTLLMFVLLVVVLRDSEGARPLAEALLYIILTVLLRAEGGAQKMR